MLVDNYGRKSTATASTFNVKIESEYLLKYDTATGELVALDNQIGSTHVTVSSKVEGSIPYTFTVDVVSSSDIKAYSIDTIGTVYASKSGASAWTKTVKLIGKTSNGTTVTLKDDKAQFLTSSDISILIVSNDNQVTGQKAGKAIITAYLNNQAVATQEVTVSEEAPYAKTAVFDKYEYTVNVGSGVTVSLTVKDQYGVAISPFSIITSSNIKVATVSGMTVHGVALGTTTITYANSTGVTATATIVVSR